MPASWIGMPKYLNIERIYINKLTLTSRKQNSQTGIRYPAMPAINKQPSPGHYEQSFKTQRTWRHPKPT